MVVEAKQFIKNIPDEPFLMKNRLRNKACLGAVLAVFSPGWVFRELDEKLRSVPWEEMAKIYGAFAEIKLA